MILKNGDHVIGLFRGMFEKNMLRLRPQALTSLHRRDCAGRAPCG